MVFADINLSEAPIRGPPHNPGAGGWPTVRYFTKETGVDGANYEKKTSGQMCDELGDLNNMVDYVESASGAELCAASGANCNEKEMAYLEKRKSLSQQELKGQLDRLQKINSDSLKDELKEWNFRRQRIIMKLMSGGKDEL